MEGSWRWMAKKVFGKSTRLWQTALLFSLSNLPGKAFKHLHTFTTVKRIAGTQRLRTEFAEVVKHFLQKMLPRYSGVGASGPGHPQFEKP